MIDLLFLTGCLALVAWAGYQAGFSAGKHDEMSRRADRAASPEDIARMIG